MLVKMQHSDTGHKVDVHPDMVADYEGGGYRRAADDVSIRPIPSKSDVARMPKDEVIEWLEAHGVDYPHRTPLPELRGALRRLLYVNL